ncbi:3'(2'),5'-bisphosphate nucleotidase [Oscillatoria acuminata]|uniref:3'(2'),5'-bisphosphate nucleotidase, HAL2 family n=1 Tax=Oscillatoria acuminata PCC 6304 TaxID=56110 RepID=K9TJ25_9CYAN|nr:3'(2'),5'-bisphosphate nucleotidase [Oscillatoria acuminata]AFY82393.1 3'(2'),5'-bisphosphate nucleotidase, HAL2 family [Oscillatoria acuminata PCC 6304]
MSYEREKQVAIDAAIAAAKLCQAVRREIPVAMEKIDKSPVTVADYGSQALICKALDAAFPEDAIVGEEDATDLRSNSEQLTKVTHHVQSLVPDATPEQVADWIDRGNGEVGGRFWTLDPIDGTKGFLRQDQYAVAIALIEDNEVKVGVMACPALNLESGEEGTLFVAVRGEGATMQAISGGTWRSLRVVAADDVENMRFVESVEASHGDQSRQTSVAKAVGFTAESVRMDSQAKYGIVASGQAALYMRLPSPKTPDYRENIWDHAAGAIVVEEAGGRVTDMHGNSLPFGMGKKMVNNQGIVVSNGTIHDTVLKALQES